MAAPAARWPPRWAAGAGGPRLRAPRRGRGAARGKHTPRPLGAAPVRRGGSGGDLSPAPAGPAPGLPRRSPWLPPPAAPGGLPGRKGGPARRRGAAPGHAEGSGARLGALPAAGAASRRTAGGSRGAGQRPAERGSGFSRPGTILRPLRGDLRRPWAAAAAAARRRLRGGERASGAACPLVGSLAVLPGTRPRAGWERAGGRDSASERGGLRLDGRARSRCSPGSARRPASVRRRPRPSACVEVLFSGQTLK